jgi:hypothetical protein
MTFEPDVWDIPQELTVLALEDEVNIESPYNSGFNMTLESEDMNFDGQSVPDFEVTVEDNDEGMVSRIQPNQYMYVCHGRV